MTQKPFVSFVLIAFNQEGYIRDAVQAALAQEYPSMEIILSDDCSQDRTYEIMRRAADAYQGPHSVRLNRNKENLGIVAHVNRVIQMAAGELLVAGAGDDLSIPTRVETTVDAWLRHDRRPDGLVFGWEDVEDGTVESPPKDGDTVLRAIIEKGVAPIRGASAAWTRRLMDEWGPIPTDALAEDQVLAFRAQLKGGLLCDQRSVVRYRKSTLGSGKAGHTRLSWRLWAMHRALRFYEVYESDLRRMIVREPERSDVLNVLLRRLRQRIRALEREIDLLSKGTRLSGLIYAAALLVGRTWTREPFDRRVRRALTVLRRLTFEGREVEVLDARDHHGNRQKSR